MHVSFRKNFGGMTIFLSGSQKLEWTQTYDPHCTYSHLADHIQGLSQQSIYLAFQRFAGSVLAGVIFTLLSELDKNFSDCDIMYKSS